MLPTGQALNQYDRRPADICGTDLIDEDLPHSQQSTVVIEG
jgi:hypothetical protein